MNNTMVSNQTEISVIIPLYNVERYVEECIESVIAQKGTLTEIICINDGSTDATGEIIKRFAEMRSNIITHSQENKGLSAARNQGIELSTGRYIYFLDGDDKLADDGILRLAVEEMDNFELDILEMDAKSFFETEEDFRAAPWYEKMYQRRDSYGMYEHGADLLHDLCEANEYFCSSCIRVYRRDFLTENELFFKKGICYEDNLHTLECYLEAGRVKHIKKTIMLRRIRKGSIMMSEYNFYKFMSIVAVYMGYIELWDKYSEKLPEKDFYVFYELFKNTAIEVYRKLNTVEREKLGGLIWPLRNRIEKEILCVNKPKPTNVFSFPYHLFNQGDHIIIYGAGNVGKAFYSIAHRDKIVNIDGIFDKKGNELSDSYTYVNDVSGIADHKNEKWLIAIEDRNLAEDAKRCLIANKVPYENIFWGGYTYKKVNASRYFAEKNKFTDRMLRGGLKKRMFFFMQPEHGNLGDYAISLGEKLFLDRYFEDYDVIWVTTNEWLNLKDDFIESIRQSDIILINGGGYFGNLWSSGDTCKEIITEFPENIKILFPNTLTYDNPQYKDNEQLHNDINFIKNQSNLHTFWRDIYSYEFLSNSGGVDCFYAPDMALFLNPIKNEKKHSDRRILLCFRSDVEKIFYDTDRVKAILNDHGYAVDERDIHLSKCLSLEDGYNRVKQYIKSLQDYDLIITDRLHAMIMSVIAEVPCIAYDNLTRKISGVYPWVKSDSVKIISRADEINDEMIDKMCAIIKTEYRKPRMEFDNMADIIRNIIDRQ